MPNTSPSGAAARTRAIGRELVRVQQWLRDQLTGIHDRLDHDDIDLTPLRAHCVAFCAAVTSHHTSEDGVTFPALAAQEPALAGVLNQLSQDHQLVEDIVRRLGELLASVTPDTVETVRREIDGLSAILESHFRWEEKALVDALNTLETARPTEQLFGAR